MKNILIIIYLVTLLLFSSCSISFIGNKLGPYDDLKSRAVKNESVYWRDNSNLNSIKSKGFKVINKSSGASLFKVVNSKARKGCLVNVEKYFKKTSLKEGSFYTKSYAFISAVTLTLIPYYAPEIYSAEVKIINLRNRDVVKSYNFEEKVYIIDSLIISLLEIPLSFFGLSSDETKVTIQKAKKKIDDTILRVVSSDIANISACK